MLPRLDTPERCRAGVVGRAAEFDQYYQSVTGTPARL